MFHWKYFKSTATPNDQTAVPKSKPTANTSWGARKGTESRDFGWNEEEHVRHFKDQRLDSCHLRLQRCSCFDAFMELSFADEEFLKYFLE